ncbi:MAG TPA: DUF4332 domain-containing protein [Chloroflexi bacterium]|nr:DUF4332 domain-containing protein [Chloroflexota bacterium]
MKIQEIEGIGPVYAEKLAQAGITTTEGLLKAAGHKGGRKALAAETGIDESMLLEWVNRADLMRVKGIGSEYSDLLEAAGVDTVKELAQRNPENLHAALTATNAEKNLVRRLPPLSAVKGWVEAAKTMEAGVTH